MTSWFFQSISVVRICRVVLEMFWGKWTKWSHPPQKNNRDTMFDIWIILNIILNISLCRSKISKSFSGRLDRPSSSNWAPWDICRILPRWNSFPAWKKCRKSCRILDKISQTNIDSLLIVLLICLLLVDWTWLNLIKPLLLIQQILSAPTRSPQRLGVSSHALAPPTLGPQFGGLEDAKMGGYPLVN